MSTDPDGPTAGEGPAAASAAPTSLEPTTTSSWVEPTYAFWVVAIVAVVILLILGVSVWELKAGSGDGKNPVADPNAGTIAALAAAAFTSLSSLTAAYFGIKVAGDQSAQSTEMARQVATTAQANSTTNGDPPASAFS